jgi:GNAT superfamily N-acetyltransferase
MTEVAPARDSHSVDQKFDEEIRIRQATEQDAGIILTFIRELADYERLLHEVVATEDDVRDSLFGARRRAEVILGVRDGRDGEEPVGFALYFHNYSTFLCRHGLYVEDLYVRPEFRGRGYGKKLLSHLARLAVERQCGRMEWVVVGWNESAIGFYGSLGARAVEDWRLFRLTGDRLNELARQT